MTLAYRHHLETQRKIPSARVTLMKQLAGSHWGAGAKALYTAAFSLRTVIRKLFIPSNHFELLYSVRVPPKLLRRHRESNQVLCLFSFLCVNWDELIFLYLQNVFKFELFALFRSD